KNIPSYSKGCRTEGVGKCDGGESTVFFCQAEDGIRDGNVTGVQTCALPISHAHELARLDPEAVAPPAQHEHRRVGAETDQGHTGGDEGPREGSGWWMVDLLVVLASDAHDVRKLRHQAVGFGEGAAGAGVVAGEKVAEAGLPRTIEATGLAELHLRAREKVLHRLRRNDEVEALHDRALIGTTLRDER